jgi:hypothetical protein
MKLVTSSLKILKYAIKPALFLTIRENTLKILKNLPKMKKIAENFMNLKEELAKNS